MKKYFIMICFIIVVVILTACKDKENIGTTDNVTPTQPPGVTVPVKEQNDGENKEESNEQLTIQDYFPFRENTEYVYEGENSEYASYRVYVDFIDKEKQRIQTRKNNGGTETVSVLELKDGKLSEILKVHECYYRDNLLEEEEVEDTSEILLMEPLKEGTRWELSDGRKRYISGTNVNIETAYGTFKALEVTTEGEEDLTKDYYALNIGLVKTIFDGYDIVISSSLSEVNKSTTYIRTIDIYYPDNENDEIHPEELTLSFKTNDITSEVLLKEIKKNAEVKNYQPLMSTNTKINSMYLGKDNIVHVDFSAELVTEMNAGSGFEQMILQCITNTLGEYYDVEEVYITVEENPYESGHILMKEGETFKVENEELAQE